MSITNVILKKGGRGGGIISRREIPSPSIFDKGKNIFNRKERPLLMPDNNITENSHSL